MRFWTIAVWVLCLAHAGCQRQDIPIGSQNSTTVMATGKDLEATAWSPELPADIVLVIDQSGSMSRGKAPTDPSGLRVKGSSAFLEFVAGRSRADLSNRFGVVNFGTEAPPKNTSPLLPIASLEDPALERIRSQLVPLNLGETNMLGALQWATQILREGKPFLEPRNRAIVIFTDGEPDDPRRLKPQEYFAEIKTFVEQELRPNRVDVFVIGIDAAGKRWSLTVPLWQQLVGADHVFTTPSMDRLKDQFNRIVQRIWHLPEVNPVVVSSQGAVAFEVEPYLAAVEFHLFPGSRNLSLQIYRPDGKLVKPGQDPDTPQAKHLSTFDRIVVYEPEPGRWRYEVVGGPGAVEVLRNPIPLRMHLLSPLPIHPQGKPMRLIAEFKRTDGKPVRPHPDYPLGLAADVEFPTGKYIPVKFPLEQGRDGVFTGEPDIEDTMAAGDYRITLKVTGGGKYQNKLPAVVQVKPLPYLVIQQPLEGTTVDLGPVVKVRAQLQKAGKPLPPREAFANHPDYLVIAQAIRMPGGDRSQAVWLAHVKQDSAAGYFEGTVPLPTREEGLYTLAVKLAPEEDAAAAAVADQNVIRFTVQRSPTPRWIQIAVSALIGIPILTFVVWRSRRYYLARLRLPVYFWIEGEPTWRAIVSDRANDSKELPGLEVRMRRAGTAKQVRLEPAAGAKLLAGDGRELSYFETREGGRILVQSSSGQVKAVNLTLATPPSRPEPSEQPPSDEEGIETVQAHQQDEIDWGFGKTSE